MISVFVATSGRSKMFKDMLGSLIQTVHSGWELEICCVIDADYEAWDIARNLGLPVWFSPQRRGALQAWNDALTMTNGDFLVPAGDDQIFHPGWLEYALESHRDRLGRYGMVGDRDWET